MRFAWRYLWRTPRNTAIAIAILGVAIGANTAMFSAINYVLLRPLPFPDAARLLRVRSAVTGADGQVHAFNMTSREAVALRESHAIDGLVAFSPENLTLGGDRPERLSVVFQSDGIDRTLQVKPVLGRGFTPDEMRQGLGSGVAIVSHAWWQTRFGGASTILGTVLRLDDRSFTVIGVMPPQYAFPYRAQVWVPFVLDPADRARDFAVFAHSRPGASDREIGIGLDAVAATIRGRYADVLPTYHLEAAPIRQSLIGTQDAPVRALSEIVAVLLLIACVNVATLLLARAASRRRQFAIQSVLGASRAHHVRQLVSESVLLAAIGCAAGLLIASWLGPLTATLMPSVLSGQLGLATPQTDWRVALFAVAASLVSAIVAGVVPAFGSWRSDPARAIAEGGRAMSAGRHGRALLGGLIVAETALTLVLLAGAGLIIRNFVRLQTSPLGFDARGLMTITLTPPSAAYPPGPVRGQLVRRLVDEARSTPGVVRAAITSVNPLGDGTWGAPVVTEETAVRDPTAATNVNHRLITPGLLETMGIPLLRGRAFTDQDRADSTRVAIVSDRLARHLWPGVDPIGRRIRIARPGTPWLTVVGVAGDVSDSHDPGVPFETWYLPFDQNAASPAAEKIYVMVRGASDALVLLPAVRQALARVDKTLAPYDPAAMDRYYADSLSRERVGAMFMLGFGVFGLVLAALGVYGVMAFSVAQRTAEIGIRMALGARTADILPLVLKRSIALVAGGIAAGGIVAIGVNRALAATLTQVAPLDRVVLAGAGALILATAIIACLVPAIAASRLDPLKALRAE